MTKLEIKKLIKENLFKVKVLHNHTDTLYRQLWEKDKSKSEKLIGKCFKTQNSYSCPETDEDRWWLYGKVVSVEEGTHGSTDFLMDKFQNDKHGNIEFKVNDLTYGIEDWTEISEKEYVEERAHVLSRIIK